MPKSDWVYVGHMLDMCQKGFDLSIGKTRENYDQDEVLQLALTHIIQVIGEAAAQVSEDFKQKYPEVPWHEIIGMRHRIVHDYMNVDEDVVWSVVRQDLKPLVEVLRTIIPQDMI
jgi:uncharacterized protein with HEPN domain